MNAPRPDLAVQLIDLPHGHEPAPISVALAPIHSPLLDVKARLQVCVGETTMTIGELGRARLGQVLALDREVDAEVDILLEGRLVARGQLVAVGEHFGVRLTELPAPLLP